MNNADSTSVQSIRLQLHLQCVSPPSNCSATLYPVPHMHRLYSSQSLSAR